MPAQFSAAVPAVIIVPRHSFAAPALGIKCDAYPGRLNQVSVFINRVQWCELDLVVFDSVDEAIKIIGKAVTCQSGEKAPSPWAEHKRKWLLWQKYQ